MKPTIVAAACQSVRIETVSARSAVLEVRSRPPLRYAAQGTSWSCSR